MDFLRSNVVDDNVGIPEDLRCKRSDGKQWRCSALSMPDKTVCEKHYIQAKKRAANSALRASLKKAKRKLVDKEDIHLASKADDVDLSLFNTKGDEVSSPAPSKKSKENVSKRKLYSPEGLSARNMASYNKLLSGESLRDVTDIEDPLKSAYRTTSAADSSGSRSHTSSDDASVGNQSSGSSESSEEVGEQTCHQCQRNDRMTVIWCLRCNNRGYCSVCLSKWYPDISLKEVQKACPACCGACNCKACFNPDILIKPRIQEMPLKEKLQHLHNFLSLVLPVLQEIHFQQSSEMELEMQILGGKVDIPRVKIHADEQMCCDCCKVPIIDYHRHCSSCLYDLCLTCCGDLRQAAVVPGPAGKTENSGNPNGTSAKFSDFNHLFPGWRANNDGSIPCPPQEFGGCGCQSLLLRRIFKMNWVAKLVKNTDEIVHGCKLHVTDGLETCPSDPGARVAEHASFNVSTHTKAACREKTTDNFLYCPSPTDFNLDGIGHFQKHWQRGEPVIVKGMADIVSTYSWDPMIIWKGIEENLEANMEDGHNIVKAVDCLDWSEVSIEFRQFMRGFSEGRIRDDGWPQMLKLKDWPHPNALEDFLYYQRPHFMSKLPLLIYIHPKWGFLNLAAKLPHDSSQSEMGTKLFIAYGTHEELGRGDSVTNLHVRMCDVVYLLLHTCEGTPRINICKINDAIRPSEKNELLGARTSGSEMSTEGRGEIFDFTSDEENNNIDGHMGTNDRAGYTSRYQVPDAGAAGDKFGICSHIMGKRSHDGALWNVFRRLDVPKLTRYLESHWREFDGPARLFDSPGQHLLHDEAIFLGNDHIRKLKEEFNIEPWVFQQNIGEAVFIPAGCPFQVRNLQSSVQLSLDFLSPDSLEESVKLTQDIRGLLNDHEAKLQMLEVGKMALYATSSAVREIQKLILNPRIGGEGGFEDPNLTALVSENIEKMVKWRKISCM